ncbi:MULTISPECIES: DUF2637 domain-containing protein [Mycobacterium avium complex (MAC)]|uniref:DUF2637 domain-containing protein n=1 Tax=Mycobacterium colombiense TaxID=339268 RepID=A0A329LLJ9_9MYCO|nr:MULTISPECIES: DUF2637 domain-containing protein [Mycobacterium avium complex (MAC)]OBG17959.1 hypothetical protein A5769_13345 [Mycobacterium intracellulare]RAV08824.1 DUF2637 domain-containing protein [Mycobacterium colombiense]
MTVLDNDAPARNGADTAEHLRSASSWPGPAPAELALEAKPSRTLAQSDVVKPDDTRRHAVWFFWMWLLFATVVSIGGNVIHAWMTAPAPHLKLLASIAAAVPPAILLGSTHSVALLIKNRRHGYRRVDAAVLGAALLLMAGVAGCAFAMSFVSLRNLMILVGMSAGTAWLWPIGVDMSLICSTLALLTLASPRNGGEGIETPAGATVPLSPAAGTVSSGPRSEAERRLWWESIAAVIREQNSDVRKIGELPTTQLAEILHRLYDKRDSKRAVCADHDLHHRDVRTITHTADDVLARLAAIPSTDGTNQL